MLECAVVHASGAESVTPRQVCDNRSITENGVKVAIVLLVDTRSRPNPVGSRLGDTDNRGSGGRGSSSSPRGKGELKRANQTKGRVSLLRTVSFGNQDDYLHTLLNINDRLVFRGRGGDGASRVKNDSKAIHKARPVIHLAGFFRGWRVPF